MSSSSSRDLEDNPGRKRNLPSWMSGRPEAETSAGAANADAKKDFSKLMGGVVFVLSGFVNPERATLRSQAIEMGAEYQPDWNSDCTLLVCAFPNTPKFRQVQRDSGTIVSKEWISECFNKGELVEIEPYLMNAGKPWKRQTISNEANRDSPSSNKKFQKQEEKSSRLKPTASALSRGVPTNRMSDSFSPSRVKQWASDDFRRTLSWLENQDEKPEKSDMKKIAGEGILTCLQDTIDALKQGQRIQQITEQWACLPRAVEELIKFDCTSDDQNSINKDDLCRQALDCKGIYEAEYSKMDCDSSAAKKLKAIGKKKACKEDKQMTSENETAYDSDETIEMTEDEIDQAFCSISSTLLDAR